MIHLRKLHTIWSKSALKSYKSPVSRSKLLGVLLKAGCSSSVKVEVSSREPNTNVEDDTNKEGTNLLSKISSSTESMDIDTKRRRFREEKLYQDEDGLSRLREQMSIEDFKEFVKKRKDLQKSHIAMGLVRKLCSILKSKLFPLSGISRYKNVESLISQDEMKDVFETIERNLPFLNESEWLRVLEACTILKISESSLLMQKVLKLLCSNINSIYSIDVILVYCIIEMYYSQNNPQIAALRVACNKFFEHCFESNFHPKTTEMTMSRFVPLEFLPANVRKCLMQRIIESNTILPLWSYSYVVKGLLFKKDFEDEFYQKCVDYLLLMVTRILETDISPMDLSFFLKTYKTAVFNNCFSYDEKLLDKLALKIVKTEPSFLVSIQMCHLYFQLSHFSYALFDYLMRQIDNVLHSGELKTLEEEIFFKLTKILSKGVKQHPKILNPFLREQLEAACLNFSKINEHYKVSLPLNLAILGIYNDHLIENSFTSENGGELTEKEISGLIDTAKNSLLLLHQAVVTFHPSYQSNLLSEVLMKKLALNNNPLHNLWEQVVEECFGGPKYVMKNCTTSLHHTLSYVVVLDKNNVPIDVASIQGTDTRETHEPFNIADIPTSEETRVIVIQDFMRGGQILFKNVSSWNGKFQLNLDVLEMYCGGVIPLFVREYKAIESHERVPYLLGKIEKKFGVIGKPTMSETNEEANGT